MNKIYTRNAKELPDLVTITELAYFLSWSELTIKRKIKRDIFPLRSKLIKNPRGGGPVRVFKKQDILETYCQSI